jgi:hypothetical protein
MAECNPLMQAMAKPRSMRAAINAVCAACMGCTVDHIERGFRREIRNCTAPHRPCLVSVHIKAKKRPRASQKRGGTLNAPQGAPTTHCPEVTT